MIKIKFKNLAKSKMVQKIFQERLQPIVDKFEDLNKSRIDVTLEMENSAAQPGPDLFKVKVHIVRGRYDGITVEKEDANPYIALADVIEHMQEVLNRFGDRVRVKERRQARKFRKEIQEIQETQEILDMEELKIS